MCSVKEGFLLCSCDKEQLDSSQLAWTLDRVDDSLPVMMLMGSIASPRFDPEIQLSKEFLEKELNKRNCFDFDYAPKNNDYLMIKIEVPEKGLVKKMETIWVKFRFEGKQWKIDQTSPFEGWKQQLESYKMGKIQ